jgi:rhodanese-related sulfurtransferase
MKCAALTLALVLLFLPDSSYAEDSQEDVRASVVPIVNPLIDSQAFLRDVQSSHEQRLNNIVTEDTFLEYSRDADTIILDARSAERFTQLHVAGARSLPFTEFTEKTLAKLIPSKDTRILIYCNNNVQNSPVAFASKIAPASLNLSTYTSLYSYGYRNVFELGPLIDPATAKIRFEGTLAAPEEHSLAQ